MFYSQFILAKKGPLGTIWIAAHLERKLRKNQVADTDIGVSVDSILFPEVPIALRLSSHLLLGVVRIYSRKVNYLFHDCSEALLKIKQAFRSTAVDLPPEESTAPYHSITLPETFHLDDFELPDSAYEGDFVDRHVSSKEQITLQDTMNGTGYSTSQFGLDERFGDGNASQIGLDLDEDLFLDKHPSPQHASTPLGSDKCAMHQGPSLFSLADMEIDEGESGFNKDKCVETPNDLSEQSNNPDKHIFPRNDGTSQSHGYNIQTPDLNEVFFPNDHIEGPTAVPSQIDFVGTADEAASTELVECAQAPSTPGLMEETISAAAQGSPALSPQRKTSPVTGEEAVKSDKPRSQLECRDSTTESGPIQAEIMDCEPVNVVQLTSLPTSSGFVAVADQSHSECGHKSADNLQNDIVCEVKDMMVGNQIHDDGDAMLPEVNPLDGLVSVANTEVTIITSKLSTESILESSVTLTTKSTSLEDNAEPSVLNKQDYKEDIDHCPNSNAYPLNIDSNLQLNQASSLSAEDGVLVESIPEFSRQDLRARSGTPVREEALNVSESSFDLQGEDFNIANATNTDLKMHQQSGHALSEPVPGVSNPNEPSTGPILKDTQLDHFNCSSSSEFPEPEKMLLAPAGNVDQVSELGQLTAEKGVIESDGSVNRISCLCGKKRRLMESTPVLQNGTSTKMSGKSRIRRNTNYVPDDDDLLASILVGKRTPVLRIGSTPPPPKAASLKRPRVTTRLAMPKRKVLLDDTTVLHADAIRQQLINAQDIRRMRKKAPCTRPEIWMIEKSLLEDEIFNESIITGVSVELNTLHNRRYDSEVDESHSRADPSKEAELSRSSEFVRETSGKEMAESIPVMPNKADVETQGPSGTSASVEALFNKDSSAYDAQEHLGSLTDLPQPDLSNDNQTHAITMMENNMQDENAEVHMSTPAKDCGVEDTAVHKNEDTAPSSEKIDDIHMHLERQPLHESKQPASELSEMNNEALQITEVTSVRGLDVAEDETRDASVMAGNGGIAVAVNINCPHDAHADVGKKGHTETLVSIQDSSFFEVEGKDDGLDARVEDGAVMQKNLNNEVNSFQANTEIENVPSAVGENSGLQELNVEGGMDVESAPVDLAAAKECSDFCSAVDGNDTEFLNVDDEADYDDAADHDMPNPEEAQSLENSGWSSRTRGVARYLKVLFDEESGRGRKNVAMDHLLAGKTRKEASRMFFETLVLKTRDYINVEQENPLECINIKPTIKLLKSEF
ncbi:sister chromatid cohesion 1 protein 4-like [Phoenix dactylifera]|uniref:Sister chromatid cohesion 1 protein 4-like n=1 Tax=Phoenix dactylifera TaxID=42345 RepID=A0A8B7BYS0_PHODC|nr:sister chromatid cohesion 1 protein 4-like [Phoenix dactylifera]